MVEEEFEVAGEAGEFALDTGEADSKAHAYKLARTMAKMYDKPGEET